LKSPRSGSATDQMKAERADWFTVSGVLVGACQAAPCR
jgi:hypothetical protein